MLWELHASSVEVSRELREHIERRLMFALSRFGNRVTKAIVFLADNNGPKGGIDKSCQIVARVRGMRQIVAEVVDVDWCVAVDRATTRIGHNVSRQIERKRDFEHESAAGV